MDMIFNILISSTIISLALWISRQNIALGGFIISLPISTLIFLALSKVQTGDAGNTFILAKSIFASVPLTLLFFVPFLLAEKFKISFWTSYMLGLALLVVSYLIHKHIMKIWLGN